MPAATLNGVSFAGTVYDLETVVRAPQKITPQPEWAGAEWAAADGTPIVVKRGSAPRDAWQLEWERVPVATRDAVRAIFNLGTTFTAVLLGSTVTAQCGLKDYTEGLNIAIPGPIYYYNVTLLIRKAT